eukprot:sb/3472856/
MESVGELELASQRTTYHVTVYTGDMVGAGTDSDVLIQLFGENEDSGRILGNTRRFDNNRLTDRLSSDRTGAVQLKSCKSNSINKFERDAKDTFYVECVDVGVVERVKVWTDGSGAGSDWYLERITIDIPSLGIIHVIVIASQIIFDITNVRYGSVLRTIT